MMRATFIFVLVVFFSPVSVVGQQVQVSRTNKTIAVTAQETATADPDIAVVTVGYQNFGVTHQEAYDDNVATSSRVFKALTNAGINKNQIETGTLKVDRVDPDEKWTSEQRKQRQFSAHQSWKIRVRAADAGKIVDVAMHNGANAVEDVDWSVADPSALQAKASGLALAKARAIAQQMSEGLGAKLGELVYASNESQASALWNLARRGLALETVQTQMSVMVSAEPINLFPQQVKQEATVYAVFAIQ